MENPGSATDTVKLSLILVCNKLPDLFWLSFDNSLQQKANNLTLIINFILTQETSIFYIRGKIMMFEVY